MTNLEQKLLDAYNDYIEYEFNERRNVILPNRLGLMYSEDDYGEPVEFYYDIADGEFCGWHDWKLVYNKKANLEEAIKFIENNGFDDYYAYCTEEEE